MKNIITLFLITMTIINGFSQEEFSKDIILHKDRKFNEKSINSDLNSKSFNTWSLSANSGYNMPAGPFTVGYYSAKSNYITSPMVNHFDINLRKMFNTKFGLMLGLGYDHISNTGKSMPFSNNLYSSNLQAVINVHQVLNWEEFTHTFGLQLHFGPGLSFLQSQVVQSSSSFYKAKDFSVDNMYSIVTGATILVKVSDHLALNIDYTINKNFSQQLNFDGKTNADLSNNATGIIYSAGAGITFYLGKKDIHADWFNESKSEKTDDLLARLDILESKLRDVSKNVTAAKLEQSKDVKVDNSKIINNAVSGNENVTNVQARNMINSQYVNVFFDFDKSTVSTGSISVINFLLKYLKENPESKLDVIGYADELGDTSYNKKLSQIRANNVADIIIKSGIDASRLTIIAKGEDDSVPKESEVARQLVRRVIFKIN
ncbi:hypothetical protein FFWV33_16595 [Flavobacterium faecale]|uniref:OmpA-like domain-containing protein n=1 Tax=Flavobacterium faecale TaxID=1355330 RepID=A0A2S1LH48_9FLAO|nr:OmpA family protein [Flavobacterium faecale]AWG23028.1 hypothetical protein FFWV33_16595 [Flavobacterium faecale]